MRVFRQRAWTKVRKLITWLLSSAAAWFVGIILVNIFVPEGAHGFGQYTSREMWVGIVTVAALALMLFLCVPVMLDRTRIEVDGPHVRVIDKRGRIVADIANIATYIGAFSRHTSNNDVMSQVLTLAPLDKSHSPIVLDAEHLTAGVFDDMYAFLVSQGMQKPDSTVAIQPKPRHP